MSQDLCQRVEENIGDLIDADPATASGRTDDLNSLREHAEGCSRCRHAVDLYSRTVTLVRHLPDAALPPDFLSGLREKVDAQRLPAATRAATRERWRQPLWWGLAATLVVALGLALYLPRGQRAPQVEDASVAGSDGEMQADSVMEVASMMEDASVVEVAAANPVTLELDAPPEAELARFEARLIQTLSASKLERRVDESGLQIAFHIPREYLRNLRDEVEHLESRMSGAPTVAAEARTRSLRAAPLQRDSGAAEEGEDDAEDGAKKISELSPTPRTRAKTKAAADESSLIRVEIRFRKK